MIMILHQEGEGRRMISSHEDYLEYVREDRIALNRVNRKFPLTLLDLPLRYQLVLRRAEYYTNCKRALIYKPLVLFFQMRHRVIGNKCGYSIPLNTCGKGLNLAHVGTVIINAGAHVGDYCRIHADVNIGTAAGHDGDAPTIGNCVYIGPGAKIFGKINIADGIAIGANAVVNKSFEESYISIAGVPAKKISNKGSRGLLYSPYTVGEALQ